MFHEIKTQKDIEQFLEQSKALQDGDLIDVHYVHNDLRKDSCGGEYYFGSGQTKLSFRILVENMIVEIEFEDVWTWHIKDPECEIVESTVIINENNHIVWSDHPYTSIDARKEGSYVIANSMKWRIAEPK